MHYTSDDFQLSDDSDYEYDNHNSARGHQRRRALSFSGHEHELTQQQQHHYEIRDETSYNTGSHIPRSTYEYNTIATISQNKNHESQKKPSASSNNNFGILITSCLHYVTTHLRREVIVALLLPFSVIMVLLLYQEEYMNTHNVVKNKNSDKMSMHPFDNLADLYTTIESNDIPFFWQVSHDESDLIKNVLVNCFNAKSRNSLSLGIETVRKEKHYKYY